MTDEGVLRAVVTAAESLGWAPTREAEEIGPYAVLGELAHRLVSSMQAGQAGKFADFFEAVETTLRTASQESRELIIVGFLEDLQNVSLNRDVKLSAWTPWLGTGTRAAWDALESAWSGDMSALRFNDAVRGDPAPPGDSAS